MNKNVSFRNIYWYTGNQYSHGQRKGEFITDAFQEYEVITPRPSWAEQWPDVWLEAVVKTISECVEKSKVDPREIAGLAISGLYGGSGIPVDEEIKPLYPCLIWMDRRAREETQWVKDHVPQEKFSELLEIMLIPITALPK